MAQVTYTKENDKWYADFDNRKKTLWKERWINPIDMPEPTPSVTKGEIINIDMTGSGTPQQYRVLKVNENIVEVLAMTDVSNQQFASSGQIYENGTLDTYCNTTWYDTLSATAKSAIVDKIFKQDSWYWNAGSSPVYQGKYNGNIAYTVALGNVSFGNEITRHIYIIGVQDIIDYLEATPEMIQADTTLTYTNIWQMFWNDSVAHNSKNIWLRSARAADTSYALKVNGRDGGLGGDYASLSYTARPAFQIDLTKIEWTPTTI